MTKGFLIGGPAPGTFSVRRSDGYDVTDLAFLPDGDMLILERRYSPAGSSPCGCGAYAGADLGPGAVLDGPVLMEASGAADRQYGGAGGERRSKGETLVTIASDDNYSCFQRSLVLRFALVEPD